MSNQMTLTDRIAIEAGIAAGKTFKEIAAKIHRNPATVSREIKANRTVIPATFYLGCDCRYARSCHKHNLCTDMECSIPCIKCRIVKCTEICPTYKPKHCSRIEKPPYVCNKCYYRNDCDKRRYMYSAKLADALSSRRRSDTRTGIRLSPEQLKDLDELLSAQVKKGQPLTHIYAEHEAELPVSLRSLYNYIDSGQLSVRNIDLRRKTGYKPRKGKKQTSPIPDYRVGRTYEDFKKYMESHPNAPVVQMDTVVGSRRKGQRILTMLFLKTSVMLMILIPDGKAQTVVDVFDYLLGILGMEEFQALFTVILTDNGSEFKNAERIENAFNGDPRCKLFYCDPMASWQKAEIEKNHEFIRYVIPKGMSFDSLTHNDVTLLMNHINSIKRPSLGNKSPYEMIPKGDEYWEWLMQLTRMDAIPADDVHLNPALLKHKP
jgi:IS30 family transposase